MNPKTLKQKLHKLKETYSEDKGINSLKYFRLPRCSADDGQKCEGKQNCLSLVVDVTRLSNVLPRFANLHSQIMRLSQNLGQVIFEDQNCYLKRAGEGRQISKEQIGRARKMIEQFLTEHRSVLASICGNRKDKNSIKRNSKKISTQFKKFPDAIFCLKTIVDLKRPVDEVKTCLKDVFIFLPAAAFELNFFVVTKLKETRKSLEGELFGGDEAFSDRLDKTSKKLNKAWLDEIFWETRLDL